MSHRGRPAKAVTARMSGEKVQLQVYIPADLKQALRAAAFAEDITLSDLVERLCRDGLTTR